MNREDMKRTAKAFLQCGQMSEEHRGICREWLDVQTLIEKKQLSLTTMGFLTEAATAERIAAYAAKLREDEKPALLWEETLNCDQCTMHTSQMYDVIQILFANKVRWKAGYRKTPLITHDLLADAKAACEKHWRESK